MQEREPFGLSFFSDADRTQTCNLLIRSQMLYSIKLRRLSLIASAKIERIFILCKYLTRKILKNLKKRAFPSPSDRRFGAVLLRYSALNRCMSPCAPPKPGFAGPRPLLPPPFCRRVRSRDSLRLPEAPRGSPRLPEAPRGGRGFPGVLPGLSRGFSEASPGLFRGFPVDCPGQPRSAGPVSSPRGSDSQFRRLGPSFPDPARLRAGVRGL